MRSMSDAPHPTDVRVGRLLRERRLELGISQERLGGLLGVTYQQVQKYERGTNRIGSSRLHELCKILGVRANYFFDEPPAFDQPPEVHGCGWPGARRSLLRPVRPLGRSPGGHGEPARCGN